MQSQKGVAVKTGWSILLLLVGTTILSMSLTGCVLRPQNDDDTLWAYRPMISHESRIYGDTGHTRDSLSEDWVLLGEVERSISQVEPMVKGEEYFISNTLPVDTEI